MQPTDHMSTDGPYLVAPSNNSGGLLHNKVITVLSKIRFINREEIIWYVCSASVQLSTYLYHKVITRFVRFPLWSEEYDRANPKSASFRFPSLSIRRLEPTDKSINKYIRYQ